MFAVSHIICIRRLQLHEIVLSKHVVVSHHYGPHQSIIRCTTQSWEGGRIFRLESIMFTFTQETLDTLFILGVSVTPPCRRCIWDFSDDDRSEDFVQVPWIHAMGSKYFESVLMVIGPLFIWPISQNDLSFMTSDFRLRVILKDRTNKMCTLVLTSTYLPVFYN